MIIIDHKYVIYAQFAKAKAPTFETEGFKELLNEAKDNFNVSSLLSSNKKEITKLEFIDNKTFKIKLSSQNELNLNQVSRSLRLFTTFLIDDTKQMNFKHLITGKRLFYMKAEKEEKIKKFQKQGYDFSYNFLNVNTPLNIEGKMRGLYTFKVYGEKYVDPDVSSRKLYEYHSDIWFHSGKFPNGALIKKVECYTGSFYNDEKMAVTVEMNGTNKKFILGSDFIGASKNWITVDIKNNRSYLWEALGKMRCFSGHMLWCKGFNKGWYICENNEFKYSDKWTSNLITINTAKGGSSGIFDRIDWCLKLLKIYYLNITIRHYEERKKMFLNHEDVDELLKYRNLTEDEQNSGFCSLNSVNSLFHAFENSKDWLELFIDFRRFIQYFHLQNIINENGDYTVQPLIDWFPILPEEYKDYINNSVVFIQKRSVDILDKSENSY